MAFVLFNLAAVAALVGIDQLIKLWASNVLQPVGAMPLIPHVVELRFVLNQGMAFSLLSGKQLFLIAATSAALLLVAYALFFRSRGKYLQQAALILVLGGGIGNLIDRVRSGGLHQPAVHAVRRVQLCRHLRVCRRGALGAGDLSGREPLRQCRRPEGAVNHGTA